ncbi:unnamed protein product [Absidia cylindrospora]
MVDTTLDYIASITSFDLQDFFLLCEMMMQEVDLRSMKYVWVDAICVDQTNDERRKATIYQMTNIYQHANYILAVPDLHAGYLRSTMTKNEQVMECITEESEFIYHLIHGNTDQLAAIDEDALDEMEVPMETRQWLTKYTDYFTDGLMTHRAHHLLYDAEQVVDHIYHISNTAAANGSATTSHVCLDDQTKMTDVDVGSGCVHHCNDPNCPLPFFHFPVPQWKVTKFLSDGANDHFNWKKWIKKRTTTIHQAMMFLADLVRDWSSRVWVISEFNIAKKQNNLKYWFIQLCPEDIIDGDNNKISFFNFDFDDPSTLSDYTAPRAFKYTVHQPVMSPAVYLTFHLNLIKQLKAQTFLETMLKSKASRNEDRFYAVLPRSKYQHKLGSKHDVDRWHIKTLLSVKLKLFEFMDTNDKLNFLFLAGNKTSLYKGLILPTFATSTITWNGPVEYLMQTTDTNLDHCNFNGSNQADTITLSRSLDCLCLKPKVYRVSRCDGKGEDCRNSLYHNRPLRRRLHLDDDDDDHVPLDAVAIFSYNKAIRASFTDDTERDGSISGYYFIHLIGSFEKNIWVLDVDDHLQYLTDGIDDDHHPKWTMRHTNDQSPGFNIY